MQQSGQSIQNAEELAFAVFCIENMAKALNIAPEQAYLALTEESDILKSYIVPGYDILHTQSKDYIISDIMDVMHERGIP